MSVSTIPSIDRFNGLCKEVDDETIGCSGSVKPIDIYALLTLKLTTSECLSDKVQASFARAIAAYTLPCIHVCMGVVTERPILKLLGPAYPVVRLTEDSLQELNYQFEINDSRGSSFHMSAEAARMLAKVATTARIYAILIAAPSLQYDDEALTVQPSVSNANQARLSLKEILQEGYSERLVIIR